MWKALLPGVIALVTLGLSLVSGEVIKRDTEHKLALAVSSSASTEGSAASPASTGSIEQSAVAQPAPQDVVGAGGKIPVSETGHVGEQDIACDVAARDEQARRDPRLPARPARHRRRV